MEWLSSMLGGASSASNNLQASGPISRDALLQFFAKGRELFATPDFKSKLRLGHQQGKSVQALVDQEQALVFESIGIRGTYGLGYLRRVKADYANDSELLRTFYEFVHLEERVLDEAEMPEDVFNSKYQALDGVKQQIQSREAELETMLPEDRNREIAAMFQKLAESGALQPGAPCCSKPGECSHAALSQAPPMGVGQGGRAMSEEEQMRFFQNLSNG